METECLECGEHFELKGKREGDKVTCSACGTEFVVTKVGSKTDIDYPDTTEWEEG